MVGPQEVGMIIAFGTIFCSICTMVSVYLLMRMVPPQQVFVPAMALPPQSIRSDISRLRRLTETLPSAPRNNYIPVLIDALSKASFYATIMDEEPDLGRRGLDRSINQVRDILQNLTAA